MSGFHVPAKKEFARYVGLYDRNEPRGGVYFEALNHIAQNWGDLPAMAEGIRILLHSWHWNFYRFGNFDIGLLEECIKGNLNLINRFKKRRISSLSNDDEVEIKEIFGHSSVPTLA